MYVEKEKELMDAIKQTGFELFDGSSDDAYDTLERIFMAFEYGCCCIWKNFRISVILYETASG